MATLNPAEHFGLDHLMGGIGPGKLADMVVLDRNIFTIPKDEIKEVQVETTIVGGEIVFRRS